MAGRSIISTVGISLSNDVDHARQSFARIASPELFTTSGAPVHSGVYDLRMGTIDHNSSCTTCAHGKKLCPGHRGSLTLRVAVPQPAGIAEIRRWLRVVCFKCGTIVVDLDKFAALPADRRLTEAAKETTEGRRCPRPGCGAVHPKVLKDPEDHFTFAIEGADVVPSTRKTGAVAASTSQKLYFDTIRAILERVSDSSCERLGRSLDVHPRYLTLREISFPPNTIRPGVKSASGAGNSYHDSTNLLQHLVRRNATLPEQLPEGMGALGPGGAVDEQLDRSIQNLQQIFYDLTMGSSGTNVTQGNNGKRGLVLGSRPVSSFLRNLARKKGRLRDNCLGRRVFYISRSTISGNVNFRIDEVGIPLEVAQTLQVKETVQEYNRDWLMPFFLNGRRQYPGCTHIVKRSTGEMHDVAGLREFRLEVGDVLYRDAIDGDVAFFNRQPTLERSSIGVHRIIVIQDPSCHTFQFNVIACELYNADFDGDQMNLWIARNPGARAEAMIMSGVSNWFISTKTSGPVNGEVQDSTIGCHELTRASVRMDKYHAMGLFTGTGFEAPRFEQQARGHVYTGREVASLLLVNAPVDYSRAPSSYSDVYAPFIAFDPTEMLTVVERGRLVSGVLDKRSIGAKANGGLFHLISREYGSQKALDMIFALQQMSLRFLMLRGFTVGVADLLAPPAALEQIRAVVSSVVLESRAITERLLRGEIVPPIDSTVLEFYEQLQMAALKPDDAEVLRWILGSISPDTNGFYRMIADGAKGSNPNFIHVSGEIGQTTINGARIREHFSFGRTLPYFPRFAVEPEAYGFVANSYMTGMTAAEFSFQNQNGRFDLINKALSTSVTGYFMRKGVMNNQSAIVDNLRRVAKDTKVVQFLYGEDGLDARELEKVSFRSVGMSDAELAAATTPADVGAGTPAEVAAATAAAAEALRLMVADRDKFRRIFLRLEGITYGQSFSTDLLMPVNVGRIIAGVFIAAKAADVVAPAPTAAGLTQRIARVADLCRRLPYVYLNEIRERLGANVPAPKMAAAYLMTMQTRFELSPAVLARLTDEQLTFCIDAVRQRYGSSLIDYGSAVGLLAAQAISEPLTQYMLDSHHRSVQGGTNTSGLVRISEIYGAKAVSAEQSATMQLPLRPELLGVAPELAAQDIANSIEFVTLERFVSRYDTLLEPHHALVYPPFANDTVWMREHERHHPLVAPPNDLSNWCFRFVLDKAALVLKAVDLELIVRRLRRAHPDLYVVHTLEAVPNIIIRCWLRAASFNQKTVLDYEAQAEAMRTSVLDTPIRGIAGIMRASAIRVGRHRITEAGALVKEDRFMIKTTGTNLYGAMLHRAVDPNSAISNSVGDTARLYGIEAARAKIISETRSFMEDNAPNMRHMSLYADEMTRTGRVTSIERNGLSSREHGNILLRMAFGAPVFVVTEAALACSQSRVYGIAAPQLLGSTPLIGTLYNDLVVDEAFVKANIKSVDSVLDDL